MGVKASKNSRITNAAVWDKAGHPIEGPENPACVVSPESQ